MIICFKCDRETKRILDSILASGGHADYAEVLALAVRNLEVLQSSLADRGSIVLSGKELREHTSLAGHTSVSTASPLGTGAEGHGETNTYDIPKLLMLGGVAQEPRSFAQPPPDRWRSGDPVTIGEWVFGQYNKLLPAKVSCRALAHILLDWPDGVELENMTEVAQQAAALGDALKDIDRRRGLSRDEALSTAFPFSRDRGGKGLVRYAQQFVGQINKRRDLSGLLVDFKLLNTVGQGLPHVKLTEKGWRFAVLRNPILDAVQVDDALDRFYPEEVDFLVGLVRDCVPREDYAYRTISRAIMEGADTPTSLDRRLQEVTPEAADKNLTQGFLSSQRSGAISRMADLGLVTRIRTGAKVTYRLTSRGEEYLSEE